MTDDLTRRPPLDPSRLPGGGARGTGPEAEPSGGVDPDWRVEILAESHSTNAAAVARARDSHAHGLVMVTEHQTAGRGRRDRGWITPARSALTFSVALRPPATISSERWPWLPLAAGVAVARTLAAAGYDAGLKWPNDVLLGTTADRVGEKVCGILLERVESSAGLPPAAVVGIGLNTSLTREELPIETATSLEIAGGAPVDRTALLGDLLAELRAAYRLWREAPEELAAGYRELSVTIGRTVLADLPGGSQVRGTAQRLDEFGRLVIAEHGSGEGAAEDGREVVVGAGDVVHARLR